MAESMIGSLFGLSPEMYGEQQRVSALNEGIALANLNPAARGAALTYAGAKGLGGALAGAMGVQDPQLQLVSARKTILGQIDQTNPESLIKGAQALAQMGDQQGAFALADYARKAQTQIAEQQQRLAAGAASLAAAKRERFQADPEKVRLARAVAATKGEEGSPEYISAYNESLEKQMAPVDKPDSKTEIQRLQEYASTLPVGSPQLAQVMAAINAKGQSGGTKVEVNLPASQKAEQGERGKFLAKDFYENVSPKAREAQNSLPAITSNLNVLDKGFETGFGTETAAAGAKVLSALGVQGAEKFATNAQVFLANANQAVLSKQLEQKGTQTKSDTERIEQTGARLGNTKEANKFILTVAKEQFLRDIEKRDFYSQWYRKNETYDGAEDAWFAGKGSQSLFDRPALKSYGVSSSSQIPTSKTSEATPIYAKNPQTNQRIMSTDGGKTWQAAR